MSDSSFRTPVPKLSTCTADSRLGTSQTEPAWYAAYTSSRREKQVTRFLQQRRIECFLPLYETSRRLSHRAHGVFLPLFSGYVFVRVALEHRLRVLQVPGVVRFVSFNGTPAALQETEIENLQQMLTRGVAVKPHPYLRVNNEFEIRNGPLRGLKGKLIRRKGRFRVVLSVDLLHRSVVVDIDAADLGNWPIHRNL